MRKIEDIREGKTSSQGTSIKSKLLPELPDGDDPCNNTHTEYGPLLSTKWNQSCGYNDYTPTETQLGCSGLPCDRAYTGCVATAMAQVMKHHQYPSGYSWSNMPNTYGSSETSLLMSDIGKKVGMDYNCDGSGADTKSEVASSFTSDFGYSSARFLDYEGTVRDIVKSNIRAGNPVIFRGGENTGWWIFGYYSNGHAWVCDGYLSSYYCEIGATYLSLHMNWGWGGSNDGYYSYNNFNPSDYDFNYKAGVILDIRP